RLALPRPIPRGEDLLHVAVAESGREVARVVAAQRLAPVALCAPMALGQDLRAGLQVGAHVEGTFVAVQTIRRQVVAVDLCDPERKIEPPLLQHLRRRDRLGAVAGLTDQPAAYHADGVGVETGLNAHHVAHDFHRDREVRAGREFNPGQHERPPWAGPTCAWSGRCGVPSGFLPQCAASVRSGSKSIPVMQRRPACALMWTTTSIVIVSSRLMTENSSPAPSADALTMSASWSQVCAVLPAWQLVIEPGWPAAQLRMK